MNERKTILEKRSAESRLFCFNFGQKLASGETLASGAGVDVSPSGLTVASIQINSSVFTDPSDGATVAANEGVQCRISGGSDEVDYELVAVATSSASNILNVVGILKVRD